MGVPWLLLRYEAGGSQMVLRPMWPSLPYEGFCFFFFWLNSSSLIAKVEEREVRKAEKSMIRKHLAQFVMQVCLLDLVAESQVLRLTGARRL